MKGIAQVFPNCKNVLCIWHINKNVLANCKVQFSSDDWDDFMEQWNLLVASTSIE